jgi:hypothetical protein
MAGSGTLNDAFLDDCSRTPSERIGEDFAFSSRMTNSTPDPNSTLQKDPDDWKTGDEPMTAAQRSYLETLAQDTGDTFDENLTKAEASKRIDELRQQSPRIAGD